MTDSSTTVELASIEGLLRLLDRGLGNFSLYAASSPVYVQTLADLRLAFASLWARVPLLSFSMEEEALRWEGVPVLESIDGSGNVLRSLFDYRVRTLTLTWPLWDHTGSVPPFVETAHFASPAFGNGTT